MEGYMHLTPDEFRNFPLSDVIHDKEGLRFMKKGVKLLDYSYAFGVIVQVEALGEIEMSDKGTPFENEFFTAKDFRVIKVYHMEDFLAEMNSGEDNAGVLNSGDYNYGNDNEGNFNYGNNNLGWNNYGSNNDGVYNYGDCNSGEENCGSFNSGTRNYGYYNSGNYNYGDYNSGSFNYGDFNSGEFSYGCFNENAYGKNFIRMFDKMSDWTYEDWISSPARKIMITLMKSEDKQNRWNNLSPCDKEEIKSLPNFDSESFFRTTGIKVD